MISSKSRYKNSKTVTQLVNGKDVVYITPSMPKTYTFSFSNYVVNGSDRIDNISNAFLGDATQWYYIGYANPQILQWFDMPAGELIRVPRVSINT